MQKLVFFLQLFPPSTNDLLLLQIGKSVGDVVVSAVVVAAVVVAVVVVFVVVIVANTKQN